MKAEIIAEWMNTILRSVGIIEIALSAYYFRDIPIIVSMFLFFVGSFLILTIEVVPKKGDTKKC